MDITTKISKAFIQRVYAKGGLSLSDALREFRDRWDLDLSACSTFLTGGRRGMSLCNHLEESLSHFTGQCDYFGVPSDGVLIAVPQTSAQADALKKWMQWRGQSHLWGRSRRGWCDPSLSRSLDRIPYHFAPGWRHRYQYHGFTEDPRRLYGWGEGLAPYPSAWTLTELKKCPPRYNCPKEQGTTDPLPWGVTKQLPARSSSDFLEKIVLHWT